MVKTCSNCKTAQSLTEFAVDRSKSDGHDSWCRTCRNKARRNRYHAKLPHERHRSRKYYADNREAVLERRGGYDPAKYRQWLAANPDGLWIQHLKKRHGMHPEQWFAMWQEQKGLCYLCERPLPDDRRKVAVDHDHSHCGPQRSCGVCRRGLAHSACNTAIGLMEEDPTLLRTLAVNLERVKQTTSTLLMVSYKQDALPLVEGSQDSV